MAATDGKRPEPGMFRIGDEDAVAEWWCSVDDQADEDDPWAAWVTVVADARRRMLRLEHAEGELTPAEARQLADALRQAADHAEHFGRLAGAFLVSLTYGGHFPEIDHLPTEQQRAIRDALRKAGDRYRESYPRTESVQPRVEFLNQTPTAAETGGMTDESWVRPSREDTATGAPNQGGGAE